MGRFYAKEQVLDAEGRHVDRLTPVCSSITLLEKKLLRHRETFPLEEGQRFGEEYMYTAKRYSAAAHGVYEIVDGKLKRLRKFSLEFFVDPETMNKDHTYPSLVNPYEETDNG